MPESNIPQTLLTIRDEFLELELNDRLTLLLEFSDDLPVLPEKYHHHPDLFERVVECQSPVFIFVDLDADEIVSMHATAPAEAPTTRGFASILVQGITGLTAQQVLDIPDDFPLTLGLTEAVSPLRIRGMTALLGRAKNQVRVKKPS
ncbi:MAG: SufE family protein [Terrimesophilobacter sp.]